jgi:predicted Zn-dependent peptidase
MTWIGEQLLAYGRLIEPATVRRHLAAVTPSDVSAVASAFFRPERYSLALVSPLKNSESLEKLLSRNSH